jgi:thiamine-phosphate pyrophosphorylase
MRGLYAIVDLDSLQAAKIAPIELAQHVLAAHPPLLQLRAKKASARDTLALLAALAPLCRQAGTLLFANDRLDLALLAGCDGVHVGQDDLPVAEVRRIAPELRVGVSTHDPTQLANALSQRPDYVAYGPVFATRSKLKPDPVVGVDGLALAARAARRARIPLVAIGGIDLERAAVIAPHADLGAVISALLPAGLVESSAVTARAEALHRALGAAP